MSRRIGGELVDGMASQAPPKLSSAFKLGAPFRRTIAHIDAHLSRRQNVLEFSDDAGCILRYARIRSAHHVQLSDGTAIAPGDLVADIHCWNDRVPPMPKGGADLAWGRRTAAAMKRSLDLLAVAMTRQPDLLPVRACRARVNFVGQGGSNVSVSRLIQRYGFEDVDEGAGTLSARMHDALENVLIACLVWTHNPEALRRDKMNRERRPVWASRATILRLHGRQGEP